MENKVVTRIAPSPTGNLHIGTVRTALFNYLYARKFGGKFIVRIEDTDKERSTKEFEQDILDGFEWLGLDYDEFYRQSERTDVYKTYIKKLLDEDKIFISKEENGDRSEVIRFRNPNKNVTFEDEIRGEVTFNTEELGDFVIAKSESEPLYHLAVVVDDHEMGVTHIIRGEDGISNTARQILIQEAIGATTPKYAHLPLILGPDRSKLSKRHGATSVSAYKDQGFLKEALINYLAFLGWNPGTDQEIFSKEELIKEFDLDKVQKGGAIFSEEKLKWFNKEYIEKLDDDIKIAELKRHLPNIPEDILLRAKNTILERISVFKELDELNDSGEFEYMHKDPEYDVEKILWSKNPDKEEATKHLIFVKESIEKLDEIDKENVKNAIWDYASEKGRGDVLWPMRYALSGKDKSPDPFELAYILGKEESIKRIDHAISKLQNN